MLKINWTWPKFAKISCTLIFVDLQYQFGAGKFSLLKEGTNFPTGAFFIYIGRSAMLKINWTWPKFAKISCTIIFVDLQYFEQDQTLDSRTKSPASPELCDHWILEGLLKARNPMPGNGWGVLFQSLKVLLLWSIICKGVKICWMVIYERFLPFKNIFL